MRSLVTFFAITLLVSCGSLTQAQTITEKNWSALIKLLETEKWPQAEKMTQSLLQKQGPSADTSYEGANLRYMFMVTVAAQLAHKTIDKETALKKVTPLIGTLIITPGRTIKTGGTFNYFTVDIDSSLLMCCQANNRGTEIEIFESYSMQSRADLDNIAAIEGKSIRVKARVKNISAEGFTMPRLKVRYTNAKYEIDQ